MMNNPEHGSSIILPTLQDEPNIMKRNKSNITMGIRNLSTENIHKSAEQMKVDPMISE